MARTKGSKNKNSATPSFVELSAEERINLLANLIVDKIVEDQENKRTLLIKIEEELCTVNQPVKTLLEPSAYLH
jgi:hypothetical protein